MSDMNGRAVKRITTGGDLGSYHIPAGGATMIVVNEFHGTYDMDWVLVIQDGREIQRFNMSYIERIEWL